MRGTAWTDNRWMEWVLKLNRVGKLGELTHPTQKKLLEEFRGFYSETADFQIGPLPRKILSYSGPSGIPSLDQLRDFQKVVERKLNHLVERLEGSSFKENRGASPNHTWFHNELVYTETSMNPLDAAKARLYSLTEVFQRYLKRCLAWTDRECPTTIYLAKREKQNYCSRNCRMRVYMRVKKKVPRDRFGKRGPRPKKGAQ